MVCQALGSLRQHLAGLLGLLDNVKRDFKIAWITDFPSFIFDDEEKRWVANHHPFTAPQDASVVITANSADATMPKRTSLPSMLAPATPRRCKTGLPADSAG